ncbi:MAG: flavin reductase family protein [Alphaproteobacteria bacterium]|nr:flavin reductase family protein [Alphaproteobacteria bacterium]
MPVSSELFRQTLGQFVTGIAIATCASVDKNPIGITINSFTSVSLDPPLVLFAWINARIVIGILCKPLFFPLISWHPPSNRWRSISPALPVNALRRSITACHPFKRLIFQTYWPLLIAPFIKSWREATITLSLAAFSRLNHVLI